MKSRPGFCTLSSPTRASIATLAELNPMANVLMLPYLYDSSDQMWQVLEGEIGDELMDSFDGTGVVPLSWYDAGVRNFSPGNLSARWRISADSGSVCRIRS